MSKHEMRVIGTIIAFILLAGIMGGCAPALPEASPEPAPPLVEALPDAERLVEVDRIARAYGVPRDLARPVVEAAHRHGLEPQLLARLVYFESSWRPNVVSYAGAIGLAQVRLPTARIYNPHLQVRHLKDPDISADVGAWYLARLLKRYDGDLRRALRAYNAGPTRIARDHRVSVRYASNIMGD